MWVVRNVSRSESRVLLSLSPELSSKDMEQTGPRKPLMAGPKNKRIHAFYTLTAGIVDILDQ